MLFRFETESFNNGINCTVEFMQESGNPFRINFWVETDLDLVQGLSYFTDTHSEFMHSAMDFYKAPSAVIRAAITGIERAIGSSWMDNKYFMREFERILEAETEIRTRMLESRGCYMVRAPLTKFDCKGFKDWDAVKEFRDELNNRLQQITAKEDILIPEQLKSFINRNWKSYYDGDKITIKEKNKVEIEFETSDYCAYEPVKVWYNPPYTTVEFDDGEKVTTKCQDGDTFSKAAGFAICCLKKEFEGWTGVKNVIEKCEYRANRKKLIREAQKRARKERNEFVRKREADAKKQRHEALVRKFYEERKAKEEALQRFYEHEAKRNEMAPTATDRSKYSHWANQITDMALNGASDQELSDAIRKSMNAIDAEKEDKKSCL